MKKIIAIAGFLMASATLSAQSNASLAGTIEGISSGKLCLTARTSETHWDTLSVVPFSTSGFSMQKVSVNEPVPARLSVVGYDGGFSFILEPGGTYRVHLKNGDDWSIAGSVLQDRMSSYEQHNRQTLLRIAKMQQTCDSLRRNSRYGSASKLNDSIQQLKEGMETARKSFLADNDNLLAAQLMLMLVEQNDMALTEEKAIYDALGEGAKQSRSGQILKERVARLTRTSAGKLAPDFTLPMPDGKLFTLSKMKGKIKIVDFWASWCGPCRLNNPILRQLYTQFHAQGLEIVNVSLDEKRDRWLAAVEKDGLTWTQVSSLKGWKDEVARLYSVSAIPAIFILDSDNHILASGLHGEALRAFIVKQFEK